MCICIYYIYNVYIYIYIYYIYILYICIHTINIYEHLETLDGLMNAFYACLRHRVVILTAVREHSCVS